METTSVLQPIDSENRIKTLDVLRGFAILGILIVNIQAFGAIFAAYQNPTAYGNFEGLNFWAWAFMKIFADQKFISIFSILFGAGIILFREKGIAKNKNVGWLHYKRLFWLFVIGMVHAYIFWAGDILVGYAVCGAILYIFRNKSTKFLLIVGSILFSICSLFYLLSQLSMPFWPPEAFAESLKSWMPSADLIQKENDAYRGDWFAQNEFRFHLSLMMQTFIFAIFTFWRAGGLMLIGMALYKSGILTGAKELKFYIKWGIILITIGMFLSTFGVVRDFQENWDFKYSMFTGFQFNYWGSAFSALGYIFLIIVFVKSSCWTWLKESLGAVGQMALTNYLTQTLICTTIFYGHGLGLFGKIERIEMLFIVVCIFTIQLILSPIWLKHFYFGPFEWIWRSLTYLKIQPFKK